MYNLTSNQKIVLDFLKKYYLEYKVSPTMQEVAIALGKSIPTIQGYFKELELKGAIKKTANKSRAIMITELEREETSLVSIMGTISAGNGITVDETFDDTVSVPSNWISGSNYDYYALKVSGFSMFEDGILDQDIIVVRKQNFANDGDKVVAIIHKSNSEIATLKKYKNLNEEFILLEPGNPNLEPIKVNRENLEVRGKFVGLIRK